MCAHKYGNICAVLFITNEISRMTEMTDECQILNSLMHTTVDFLFTIN